MNCPRAFAIAAILPNGKVFVTGGQTWPYPFYDETSILTPELLDPDTQTFEVLPAHTVPRVYHGIALLMLDGQVFTGGGGLCYFVCKTNHEDARIISPAYLFNPDGSVATKPVISSTSKASIVSWRQHKSRH